MRDDSELIAKLKQAGILEDPHWLNRLDEPVPLRVVMEAMLKLLDRLEPPGKPYD